MATIVAHVAGHRPPLVAGLNQPGGAKVPAGLIFDHELRYR
ncbi:hypothetical protein O7627_23130 [Solwaraspora sp. WMMD1047]|nr:hypothetical protein [Solwaraspora sp. WMMD1047]MDG4832180.1 hypothetical protein [Solwaraspora sp. WMMD1047]